MYQCRICRLGPRVTYRSGGAGSGQGRVQVRVNPTLPYQPAGFRLDPRVLDFIDDNSARERNAKNKLLSLVLRCIICEG